MFPLSEVHELDFLQQYQSDSLEPIRVCASFLLEEFHLADQWNLMEGACRFHRYGYRAFNNLRLYARRFDIIAKIYYNNEYSIIYFSCI